MTPLRQLLCGRQATKPLGALLRGRGAVYLARRGVNENEERLSTMLVHVKLALWPPNQMILKSKLVRYVYYCNAGNS